MTLGLLATIIYVSSALVLFSPLLASPRRSVFPHASRPLELYVSRTRTTVYLCPHTVVHASATPRELPN